MNISPRKILIALCVLVITACLLYVRWMATPASKEATKYFTWENPNFAYFNNQLILHLASAVRNPLPGRKLVSPGIICPPVRGVQTEKLIPVTDVFAQSGLEKLGYETDPQVLEELANMTTKQVDYYDDIREYPERVVRVTAPTESYWQRSAIYFVLDSFVLPFRSGGWRYAAQELELVEPLRTCVDDILPEILPQAIGLHIRTWPSDLSFGQRDPCHRNEVPVLRFIFSKCDWTGTYLYDNVLRVQLHPKQPVVIATDNRDHHSIRDLINHLGERAYFMQPRANCSEALKSAYPISEYEWRNASYWPIIEAAALIRAESFVGSFWSTLSQTVAVRRPGTRRTFFVQNRTQHFIWEVRWLLVVLGFCGIMWLIVMGARRWTKRQTSTTENIELGKSE
ncbi:hypothetical protein Egran_03733 [Elaphomyces granulatus]|uniref:Uncharacterized protein n=1 Tax=Elaphomyces granulatus TaxID=519963 RepID=A0A232LWP4_9EURO|nr:hypothetical protein Egran_03733 [Elaphomyces granulatus]